MLDNSTIRSLPRMPLSFLRDLRDGYLAAEHVDHASLSWVEAAIARKDARTVPGFQGFSL